MLFSLSLFYLNTWGLCLSSLILVALQQVIHGGSLSQKNGFQSLYVVQRDRLKRELYIRGCREFAKRIPVTY